MGAEEEVRRVVPPDATTIDISGKTLLPGFIDAHNHQPFQGAALADLLFGPPHVNSIHDLVSEFAEAARTTPEGEWLRGWSTDYSSYPGERMTTRWDIDPFSPIHPVWIIHDSGHCVLVNKVAVQRAGVGETAPDPRAGGDVRDERGRPVGC